MRNHRRKRRETITISASSKPALVMPAAIGASGVGMPAITAESVRERNANRAAYRAMRLAENSALELLAPVSTRTIADFDCSGRGAGYLTSRSIKNSRMSKGERMQIRLSGTRNPNARARPSGGILKEAADSQRRIERNW